MPRRHLFGDALLAHGDALLASSPSARLLALAFALCGAPDDVGALLAAGADPVAVWPQNDFIAIAAAALRAAAIRDSTNPAHNPHNLRPAVALIMNQYTALHGAAYFNNGVLITALASATSSVDVRGYDCWTPLHVALKAVCPSAVRALLRAGAHPRAERSEPDSSPLSLALKLPDTASSRAIVKALKEALKAVPGAAPPPPPVSGEMLPDTVIHELSLAGRFAIQVHSKSPPVQGVPMKAWRGCETCGKHALAGDDPHGFRGNSKMATLQKCSGCGHTFYCGKECQRADWVRHKPECLVQQQERPKKDVEFVILDLGREPTKAKMDAAVARFHERADRGLSGRDNPCPSFVDANGRRQYC